jgi:dihydrolipoamide dehydrogenase
MTSREALANTKLPKSVIIVGAGAIGVEFAYFYNAFGSKVTLVEMLPQVLPVEDEEVAKTLHRSFEKQGITMHVDTKCENFRVGKSSVKVDLVTGDKKTGGRGRPAALGHRRGGQHRGRDRPGGEGRSSTATT